MKINVVMYRTFLAPAIFAAIGIGGVTLAHDIAKGPVKVTQLSQRDIIEKLDGKDASATVKVVTFKPGQTDTPHRHTGPVFGYVLEGEYEHAIDDEPVKTYKAGDTFYEPSGSVHRVARNPSGTTRTRLLAVILHPRDVKAVTVPHKGHKEESWGVTDRRPPPERRVIKRRALRWTAATSALTMRPDA